MLERGKGLEKRRTQKIAIDGLLVALALVLGYVETLFPVNFAIPGIKLGLTNIVVLYALMAVGEKDAFVINVARILITGFLFGNGVSIIYSLAGGMLAYFVMLFAKELLKLHILTISILGAVFHNLGQIIVAMLLLKSVSVFWYLIVLWFSGILAGILTGLISGIIIKRVHNA